MNKKVSGTDCVHGSKLTQIDSSANHVAEDAAGNMTRIPKPTSWSAHFDLKYDAWNRLVEVKDGANVVALMKYDGLSRRVQRLVGSDTYDYYYNEEWQLLEERKNGASHPPLNQYLWHPYYIDALAIRLRGGAYYQYLHDANFNVSAVVDDNGVVLERYSYTPYGEVTFLNADFSVKSTQASAIGNTHLYTGRERDPETGLQLNRHRYYAAHLGRWVNRDPIEYEGSHWNLYEYVESSPLDEVDPDGLATTVAQALRSCASQPTLLLRIRCICDLLPESKCCRQLKDAKKHLDNIKDAMRRLKELRDKLAKEKSKRVRDQIQKEIDDLVDAKKGIKGHCKECKQRFGKKDDPYSDKVIDDLKDIVKGDKDIRKYLDDIIKRSTK